MFYVDFTRLSLRPPKAVIVHFLRAAGPFSWLQSRPKQLQNPPATKKAGGRII
jgi:hypothetical protein